MKYGTGSWGMQWVSSAMGCFMLLFFWGVDVARRLPQLSAQSIMGHVRSTEYIPYRSTDKYIP
jgi:hypothetical protein